MSAIASAAVGRDPETSSLALRRASMTRLRSGPASVSSCSRSTSCRPCGVSPLNRPAKAPSALTPPSRTGPSTAPKVICSSFFSPNCSTGAFTGANAPSTAPVPAERVAAPKRPGACSACAPPTNLLTGLMTLPTSWNGSKPSLPTRARPCCVADSTSRTSCVAPCFTPWPNRPVLASSWLTASAGSTTAPLTVRAIGLPAPNMRSIVLTSACGTGAGAGACGAGAADRASSSAIRRSASNSSRGVIVVSFRNVSEVDLTQLALLR